MSTLKTPRIHIFYSSYLDEIFKSWILSNPLYKGWIPPTENYAKDEAIIFEKAWNKVGSTIINGICKSTGLKFKRNYIPVYIVSGNPRSYSNPIVVSSRRSIDEFIDSLTHELIHCLFVDNKDSKFIQKANETLKNDHVALYAVMESVLPGTISASGDKAKVNMKYEAAKSFVKAKGFKNILKSLN